jgi:hypothetical protein
LKNPSQKKAGGVAQDVGPELIPSTARIIIIITMKQICHNKTVENIDKKS